MSFIDNIKNGYKSIISDIDNVKNLFNDDFQSKQLVFSGSLPKFSFSAFGHSYNIDLCPVLLQFSPIFSLIFDILVLFISIKIFLSSLSLIKGA